MNLFLTFNFHSNNYFSTYRIYFSMATTGQEFEFTVEPWNSQPQRIQFCIRHKPEAPNIQQYLNKFQQYFSTFLKETVFPNYGIVEVHVTLKIDVYNASSNRRKFQPSPFIIASEESIPQQTEEICAHFQTELAPFIGARITLMKITIVHKFPTAEQWMTNEFQLDADAQWYVGAVATRLGLEEHVADVIALAEFLRLRFLDSCTPISNGANNYLTRFLKLKSEKKYTKLLIAACTAITRKKSSGLRLIAWFLYKGQPLRQIATLEHYFNEMISNLLWSKISCD